MSASADQTPLQAFLAEPSSLEIIDKATFRAKGVECPICYSDVETETVKTTCSHIFHRECLETWLRSLGVRSGTCPSCRTVLYEGVPSSDDEEEDEDGDEYQGFTIMDRLESYTEFMQRVRERNMEGIYAVATGSGFRLSEGSAYNANEPGREELLTHLEAIRTRYTTNEEAHEEAQEAEAGGEGDRGVAAEGQAGAEVAE